MDLGPEQEQTLRALVELWGTDRFVLIGANALACHIPLERLTHDLDVAVMTSMDDYPDGLDDEEGWAPLPPALHAWRSPFGVEVDVLPAGPDVIEEGRIRWADGHEMNPIGLELAHRHGESRRLSDGTEIRVASIPVIAVLKMAAFLDRPQSRERDLKDLMQMLIRYPDEYDERKFLAVTVPGQQLDFDEAGAFVLGTELDALGLTVAEREVIETFTDGVLTDDRVASVMARQQGAGVPLEYPRARLRAMLLGLELGEVAVRGE